MTLMEGKAKEERGAISFFLEDASFLTWMRTDYNAHNLLDLKHLNHVNSTSQELKVLLAKWNWQKLL